MWPSLALASVGAMAPAAAGETNSDPARLANLVRQDCGSCHGLTLKGGLGKPLTPDHLRAWNREQLVSIILDGVPGTPMPPWRPLLSEPEARWIVDRLQQGNLP
ncbi:cytochrome c [Bradyrhizobium sp.]|uniref:c-type cytochrome n=1 Tax=Bradyrhizobium sp. TaxID=376 RepID=UPI0026102DCE|nr:cytochrome c [Bradyrhizobium sp.]